MKDIPVKVDGIDSLSAQEFNPNQEELENAVTASGQALDAGNENQLGEAMGRYGSGGADFYQDSGSINAYILLGPSNFIQPKIYFDGMSVKFYTANTNDGPSTINVNGISTIALVTTNGSALVGGEVIAGELIIGTYDFVSNSIRLNPIVELASPPAIGNVTPNTIDGTIIKATTRFEGPLGSTNPAIVKATTFEGNAGGTTINEFSIDGTLAGDSDNAVPTEKAVKAFVEIVNPGTAKAWVNFESVGALTIGDSYNITSVSDDGTSIFTVVFDIDFNNTNYIIVGFGKANDLLDLGFITSLFGQVKNVGSVELILGGLSVPKEALEVNIVFFGDQ